MLEIATKKTMFKKLPTLIINHQVELGKNVDAKMTYNRVKFN